MKFHWTATDARGNRHTGLSEAASERDMVAQLPGVITANAKTAAAQGHPQGFSTRISHSELTLLRVSWRR